MDASRNVSNVLKGIIRLIAHRNTTPTDRNAAFAALQRLTGDDPDKFCDLYIKSEPIPPPAWIPPSVLQRKNTELTAEVARLSAEVARLAAEGRRQKADELRYVEEISRLRQQLISSRYNENAFAQEIARLREQLDSVRRQSIRVFAEERLPPRKGPRMASPVAASDRQAWSGRSYRTAIQLFREGNSEVIIAHKLGLSKGRVSRKLLLSPPDEMLLGQPIVVHAAGAMDFLELWKIGAALYGGNGWRRKIEERFELRQRSIGWRSPMETLTPKMRTTLRDEYRQL
jgi:hypothetical protein